MAGSKVAAERAFKTEYEVKYYNFDFSAELEDGETINSPAVASIVPAGPTLATPSINGNIVQVKITGGTAPAEHLVKIKITTSAGESIEGSGWLEITDN